MEIPETRQAAALQSVAEFGTKRADALAQADALADPLKKAVVAAARAGAKPARIRELARVSPNTIYSWLDAAGVPVRPKRKRQNGASTA